MGACASWLHLGTPNKQCPDRYSGGKLAMPLSPSWERSFQSVYCLEFQCKCEEQGDGGKNKGKGGRDRQKKKKENVGHIIFLSTGTGDIHHLPKKLTKLWIFIYVFLMASTILSSFLSLPLYTCREESIWSFFFFLRWHFDQIHL